MTIDAAELERLSKLCAEASPGPWDDEDREGTLRTDDGYSVAHIHPHGYVPTTIRTGQQYSHADADFICAARTAMLELIAEVRRLRGALMGIVEVLTHSPTCDLQMAPIEECVCRDDRPGPGRIARAALCEKSKGHHESLCSCSDCYYAGVFNRGREAGLREALKIADDSEAREGVNMILVEIRKLLGAWE